MPRPPAVVLTRMRSISTSSPRLVWHGAEGRIELSGRVFDNWVAKSANLLVDELDATASTEVAFDLPPHWKTLALAFACWQVGAVVVLDGEQGAGPDGAEIVLNSRGTADPGAATRLVCVALGSLAMRWDGPLPAGAVDYAAEVRSHGDVYADAPAAGPPDPVLVRVGDRRLTLSDLLGTVTLPAARESSEPPTLLLGADAGPLRALAVALAVWQDEATLVLVEEGVPVTDSMLAGERVTGRLQPS